MAWESGLVEKLKRGEAVTFRPHGNSMVPIIKSGQRVTVEPVQLHGNEVWYSKGGVGVAIPVGSAVLCKVHGRLMLHKVTAYRAGQYQISNNHGHVNGWTQAKNVFGIVTEVQA